jgi:hypothetical protein
VLLSKVALYSGVSLGNGVCVCVVLLSKVALYSGVSLGNGVCVCSQVEASETSRSLVQGSHTECVLRKEEEF